MNRVKLVETLEILRRGLEKNKEIPIYDHFRFTGTTAFSGTTLFIIVLPFKTAKPFAVNGYTFLDLLHASGAEEVKFSVEGTDLIVKAGNSDFELPIRTPEEFGWTEPTISGVELDTVVAGSIKYALTTCSENKALEGYARICIKSVNGFVHLYSTDGDAMTRYNTGLKVAQPVEFCLGREFCQVIADLTPVGKMTVSNEWVCVEAHNVKIYGQNLGKPTIDYEFEINNLLGSDTTSEVPVPLMFDPALTRAIVVASIETKPTQIMIEKGEMALVTETPFGNVYDTINTDHSDIDTKINAELLQKQLKDLGDVKMIKFIKSCVVVKNDRLIRLVANMG